MKEKILEQQFLREVAARADFTIADVNLLWDAVIDIITEHLMEDDVIGLHNLCTISIDKQKPYDGWDNIHKKPMTVTEKYRVRFKPSTTIVAKYKQNKKSPNED